MREHTPHTHNQETHDNWDSFFVEEKKALHTIKPDQALLKNILQKLDEEKVTQKNYNPYISRKTHSEHSSHAHKGVAVLSPYIQYIKVVSGIAFASALVFIFILRTDTTPSEVQPATFSVVTNRNAKMAVVDPGTNQGDTDIDTLVADLNNIEASTIEPTFDDSDVIYDLSNTNSYEIQ